MGGEEGPAGGRWCVCRTNTRDQSAGCHNQERVSQNEMYIGQLIIVFTVHTCKKKIVLILYVYMYSSSSCCFIILGSVHKFVVRILVTVCCISCSEVYLYDHMCKG